MKRIILLTAVLVLFVCMMTGCMKQEEKAPIPTSEEIKQIIPAKASVSIMKYPMLNLPAPTVEEFFAKIPAELHTFTYRAEEWTEDTETIEYYEAMTDDGLMTSLITDSDHPYIVPTYILADGSKEKMLTVYEGEGYDLSIGLLEDDGAGSRAYREYCYYNEDGELEYYYNTETGLYVDTTSAPDQHYLGFVYEDVDYEFRFVSGELEYVNATDGPLTKYDEPISKGYRFSFYPASQAFRDICYEYFVAGESDDYVSYMAYYTDDGELDFINYYTWEHAVTYDKNYEPIAEEDEYEDYTFFDYLKDMYLPSITAD